MSELSQSSSSPKILPEGIACRTVCTITPHTLLITHPPGGRNKLGLGGFVNDHCLTSFPQPRRPRASPLWQLIHHTWDQFLS